MIVVTRKTAQGTEYWDAKEKRVLFLPVGVEPDFEVTVNPKSMILGVNLAKGPDKTMINGELLGDVDFVDFSKMTVPQLKEFAVENDIDIPEDIKKKDDIIKLLTDSE